MSRSEARVDLITQGLAGTVLAQSVAGRANIRIATALGLAAGVLPDADVLIRSAENPLLTLEFHRHFTHALAFVPVGALLVSLLAWPLLYRRLGFASIYGFALLGYLPGGILDACTSYGTQLLWPFSDTRIAWNIIAIVDPVFTALLLCSITIGLIKASPVPARIGVILALSYLSVGVLQRERAQQLALGLAQQRGHSVKRLEVKPTLGNLLLWRSIYSSEGRFHVDAIRAGFGHGVRVYPGGSVVRFRPETLGSLPPGSVLAQDVRRFMRFSDGFVARHPQQPQVLGDLRYSMLPNSLVPLWGIELDPAVPDRHVRFVTFRALDRATRDTFFSMLAGRPATSP